VAYCAPMPPRPPFRNRTAAELRKQAAEWREAAELEPSPENAARMIRLAEQYEALAAEREAEA
jgi:hypothetical protein